VFEKIKTASPKAIPSVFTHKLFQRANFFYVVCDYQWSITDFLIPDLYLGR